VATSIRARHIAKCHYRPNFDTAAGSPPNSAGLQTKAPPLVPITRSESSS
jgi:hypothetical protein